MFEKGAKMLLTRADCHGEDLVAVETPDETIALVGKWRETSRIRNERGISAVGEERKSRGDGLQIAARWNGIACWMGGNCQEPELELGFDSFDGEDKGLVCAAEGKDTIFE